MQYTGWPVKVSPFRIISESLLKPASETGVLSKFECNINTVVFVNLFIFNFVALLITVLEAAKLQSR